MNNLTEERFAPAHADARRGPLRAASKLVWRAVVWVVLVAALVLILIAVLIPRFGGATPYTVLTGSMRPSLPPGTLVVVKPVPAAEIGIGSVITYQLESGKPLVVTHRVVGVSFANGEHIFQTKGDANDVPDGEWVREVQVKGELWYAVPGLGYVSQAVSSEQREIIKYVGAAVLIGYAAFMFTGSIRDRVRARRTEGIELETPEEASENTAQEEVEHDAPSGAQSR